MDVMEVICYLCNQKAIEWRQNFVEIQSKHSKMLLSDLFKRLLNDFVSLRNIEDEANRICLKCLEIINDYDLMCMSAVEKENELRQLLLQTERLFDGHQIKTESENEMCHSESVFVEDGAELTGENVHDMMSTKDIEMDNQTAPSTTNTSDSDLPSNVSVTAKTKKIFIQKKGNKITLRFVKKPTAIKPVSTSALKLTSMDSEGLKSNEMQSLVTKIQEIKTISEKHLENNSAISQENKTKSPKQRAPKTPLTPCQKCNDGVLYKKWHYQFHLERHSRTCDICDVVFPKMEGMKQHMEWHKSSAGLECRVCNHQLTDKIAYETHLNLHGTVPKYQCVICGKDNENRSRLKYHARIHGEAKILCDHCGRKFFYKTALTNHMKNTHDTVRPNKCNICPKSFATKKNLLVHITSHSENREFACSFCNMKFKRKDHCKVHERRHKEDTKTEKCHHCPAAFEHKFYLRQHIEKRHNEKPFTETDQN